MDRLGFLKRLGILIGASIIPDWAIAAKKYNLIGNMPNKDKYYGGCDVAKENSISMDAYWAYKIDGSGNITWYSMKEINEFNKNINSK